MKALLHAWRARLGRRRLRAQIRTIRAQERRDPQAMEKMYAVLSRAGAGLPPLEFGDFLPAELHAGADACVRQRLFRMERTNKWLQYPILDHILHGKRLALALPAPWVARVAAEAGIPVAPLPSRLLFAVLVLAWVADAWRKSLRLLAGVRREAGTPPAPTPYGVLMDLLPAMASDPLPDPRRADLLNWYLHWSDRHPDATESWLHIPGGTPRAGQAMRVVPGSAPLPPLPDPASRRAFLAAARRTLLGGTLRLFLPGGWACAVSIHEAILADYFSRLPPDWIGREYLFNNTGWLVRPLWSYVAEKRTQARIAMVYYSVNSMAVARGSPPVALGSIGEALATWPEYVMMTDGAARPMSQHLSRPARLTLCPQIDFTDCGEPLPELEWERCVAVFDVIPYRLSYRAKRGITAAYYTQEVVDRFLTDVAEQLNAAGLIMVSKRKRTFPRYILPTAYLRRLERLEREQGMVEITADVAATRLVSRCRATIALPYTSTAVVAQVHGHPAIFYDPTGTIAPVAPAAHGVRVISDRAELARWVEEIAKN